MEKAVTVAIKLADGSFYPLVNSNFKGHKQATLATEVDGQEEVTIELYQGQGSDIIDPTHLETLVLRNLPARTQGDLDIVLDLTIGDQHTMRVHASEPLSGVTAEAQVSFIDTTKDPERLSSFIDTTTPDAEPDAEEAPHTAASEFIASIDPQVSYDRVDTLKKERSRGKSLKKWIRISVVVVCTIIIVTTILLLVYFIFNTVQTPPPPPLIS